MKIMNPDSIGSSPDQPMPRAADRLTRWLTLGANVGYANVLQRHDGEPRIRREVENLLPTMPDKSP
jgi:hypothetical protein